MPASPNPEKIQVEAGARDVRLVHWMGHGAYALEPRPGYIP
jgi:hypothetical protein